MSKDQDSTRPSKRTREGSSQTEEEEVFANDNHSCQTCMATNARLAEIDGKLSKLLTLIPELEDFGKRIKTLEDENDSIKESLESSQSEINEMKVLQGKVTKQQEAIEASLQRTERDLAELQRRHIKLECHSRRGNLKFFGIKERSRESNEDTEEVLREFLRNDLKIPVEDERNIRFDRIHRISSRRASNAQDLKPRPIIVKLWEAEWGGKTAYSHGSSHSRGVMILFKPRLDVSIEKISTDNYGRCVLAETILSDKKTIFVNIYAPNEARHQISFLAELSNSFLREYINDNVVLGGDFNCVIDSLDKRGGKPFDAKKASVVELRTLISTNNLVDCWRFKNPDSCGITWSNPSRKIQSRLDYLLVSKNLCKLIRECNIIPNIHSDHSAVALNITFDEDSPPRGPGFWKFNNSLLLDIDYVELLTFKIREFVIRHQQVNDKGLFWEMIKMELRAFTIKYSKRKAKKSRDEEASPKTRLISIQNKLQANHNESDKMEMDKLKAKLAEVEARKTQGAIVRSRTRWYEYGEKNSKYFYSLEKTNYRRKHVTSVKIHEDKKITDPKKI
ncbi:hypothetical protein ACROYT_G005090 [Oculina patagonica]